MLLFEENKEKRRIEELNRQKLKEFREACEKLCPEDMRIRVHQNFTVTLFYEGKHYNDYYISTVTSMEELKREIDRCVDTLREAVEERK